MAWAIPNLIKKYKLTRESYIKALSMLMRIEIWKNIKTFNGEGGEGERMEERRGGEGKGKTTFCKCFNGYWISQLIWWRDRLSLWANIFICPPTIIL